MRGEKKLKVQEIILDCKRKRYMLLDGVGVPVIPVVKYLKHLDNKGKSSNTQKTYCYCLKLYFEFLKEIDKDYRFVNISDLSDFVGWLRSPYASSNITPIHSVKAKRTEGTVNLTITAVTNLYDYLFRTEEINNNLLDKLIKQIFTGGSRRYKDFLYHINKDKPVNKNILKIKEPKRKPKYLKKEEVQKIYLNCSNIRDRLLIKLLFETGLRIGEILSLFVEDFVYDHRNGHRIRLKDRGELSNGAKLKTGERELYISQELMNLFDDYMYDILDNLEIDTNFVLVKLKGKHVGNPMDYQDVSALMKRLKIKTGIDIHAHLFRHTHASMYYKQTKDIKQVQERLGHSQIQTTMNLYIHPSEEDIRKSWELAQSAFEIDTNESLEEKH